jgi:hypothetical protein
MVIYLLSKILDTSLTSAYFGPDNRDCECVYLFVYYE